MCSLDPLAHSFHLLRLISLLFPHHATFHYAVKLIPDISNLAHLSSLSLRHTGHLHTSFMPLDSCTSLKVWNRGDEAHVTSQWPDCCSLFVSNNWLYHVVVVQKMSSTNYTLSPIHKVLPIPNRYYYGHHKNYQRTPLHCFWRSP
jgi:hypothetical protein